MDTIFLLFLLCFFQASSSQQQQQQQQQQLCRPDQSSALLEFKDSLYIHTLAAIDSGCSGYLKTDSWQKGVDCCSWDGVTCDKLTGHVIGLDLSCSGLQGGIDSNSSIFLLTRLQRLNLASNYFGDSPFPSSAFSLHPSLTHLNLSFSSFHGEITSEFAHLSSLISLDLSFNYGLTLSRQDFGKLSQNLTELQHLRLDTVDVTSMPASAFLNLSSSLKSLTVSLCGLAGNLPEELFLFLPNLEILNLSDNDIEGAFPFPRSNWSSPPLNFLDVSNCKFTGLVPESIGNFTRITFLSLDLNSFSGELPSSLASLHSLTHFSVNSNNFSGFIPDVSFGNLTRITYLDLSYNSFTGQCPSSFAKLGLLTKLSLDGNLLSGFIPDVFSNLKELASLGLSRNNFSGQIPSSIFNLMQITSLDVSRNQLVGPLPKQISGLAVLEQIMLNDNLINGTVPSWLFTLPSLTVLALGRNQLTGQIQEFRSKSLKKIDLSYNKMHGSIPNSISELQNITGIDLSWNNLSGILDFDLISNLSLQTLDLSGNGLTWMTNIRNVTIRSLNYLNLSHNFIQRVNLPVINIGTLDLSSNLIQGPLLVPSNSTRLLFLTNNKLTGEIPSSICNLIRLEMLDLSRNKLTGTLPGCLGNFSRTLSVLGLQMNSFDGPIALNFSKGNNLRSLDLNDNSFEGPLPPSLILCEKLEVLDLGKNRFSDGFPHWLESLPNLQVLVLRSNLFHGPIGNPVSRNPFPKLRILDLSQNAFNGLLPTRYLENLEAMKNAVVQNNTKMYMGDYRGQHYYHDSVTVTIKNQEIILVRILTIFAAIDFSSNGFEGPIPEIFGNFRSLKVLNLSHNVLSGNIPSSLGNMAALESLDLSSNKLVGEIPALLVNLNFLSVLNISQNLLQGLIPRGKQFDTFNNDSYIGNLELCGPPLSKRCRNEEAPSPLLPPSTLQEEEDSKDRFNWKIAAILGYVCGLVLGCSIAYIVFSTGKPWWFVKRVDGEWKYKVTRLTARCKRRKKSID